MQSVDPLRRIALAAVVIALATSLGACSPTTTTPSASSAVAPSRAPGPSAGGSATPSSSPAPTPAASPSSASAGDAVAGFRAKFMGAFAGEAEISGQLTMAGVDYPIIGSYQVRGADSHMVMNVAGSAPTESLTIGGTSYERRGGLWFERPTSPERDSGGLASAVTSVLDVRDTGTVTRNGRTLHHLVPRATTALPLSTLGIAGAGGEGSASIEFFVTEDGTPQVMSLGAIWTPAGSSDPVSMTIDYAFSNIGGAVVIERPDRVWATYSSKRLGYTLAYPSDWEPEAGHRKTEPDTFVTAGEAGLFVYRSPAAGFSLNTLTAALVAEVKHRNTKGSIVSNEPATVDGQKARRVEWSAVFDGRRAWSLDVVVVRGRFAYVFEYATVGKPTPADRAAFDAIVSTIDLTAGDANPASIPGQIG